MKNGRKNISSRCKVLNQERELRNPGSLLQYIYRGGEWCEMILKRKVRDQMTLFLVGLDKEIKIYFRCLGKPLRCCKHGKLIYFILRSLLLWGEWGWWARRKRGMSINKSIILIQVRDDSGLKWWQWSWKEFKMYFGDRIDRTCLWINVGSKGKRSQEWLIDF